VAVVGVIEIATSARRAVVIAAANGVAIATVIVIVIVRRPALRTPSLLPKANDATSVGMSHVATSGARILAGAIATNPAALVMRIVRRPRRRRPRHRRLRHRRPPWEANQPPP